MKKALITGITGQDGSYLTELLLSLNYEVHGIIRRMASEDFEERITRIKHLKKYIKLHDGDVTDYASLWKIVMKVMPDECYHLAAQSFVANKDDFSTLNINIKGTHCVLDTIKELAPKCRFYFAGSSEMFGKVKEVPQNENTPFHPRSVYGISKVAGFNLTRFYREAYGLFACNGILFNHESERRGMEFVSRKISNSVAKIKVGIIENFELGNLDAKRDWGHAKDYVLAMRAMLQQEESDDFIIATGVSYAIKDFVTASFKTIGAEIEWRGEGIKEIGVIHDKTVVKINSELFRPAEVDFLVGDYTKASKILGWQPQIKFEKLVELMVNADLRRWSDSQNLSV